MTTDPSAPGGTSPSAPPAPTHLSQQRARPSLAAPGTIRPWWGIGDVLLAIPFVAAFAITGLIVASIALFLEEGSMDALSAGDAAALPLSFVAISAIGQQLGQFVWPWVVSRWKGLGMASDWRWIFKPIDLAIGLLVAVVAQVGAVGVGTLVAWLIDLEDESAADNTAILTDAEGSPWLWVMIAIVVIGAPFSEEILFRGLILRAFEKRAGKIIAVIASTLLFTVVHVNGSELDGQLVLWASIATVGLVLGIAAVWVNRLWPCIIAHIIFNGFSTLVALLDVNI